MVHLSSHHISRQIGLYENDDKANLPEGTARLTSHRLLFVYETSSKVSDKTSVFSRILRAHNRRPH